MRLNGLIASWLGLALLGPTHAVAVSRIDIRVGEISHPAGTAREVSGALEMDGRWQARAADVQVDLAALHRDFPLPLAPSKGRVQGKAELTGRDRLPARVVAEGSLRELAFSDAEGLHAGENLGGNFSLDATRDGEDWRYAATLDWRGGELFWQPLYLAGGGVALRGEGTVSARRLTLERGRVALKDIGELTLAGAYDREARRPQALRAAGKGLDMAVAYPRLLKPYLEKTALSDLEIAGRADLDIDWTAEGLAAFDVGLHGIDVEDRKGRFGFYKLDARVPWNRQQPTAASLGYAGGHLLKLPLGETALAATLNGYSLTAPALRLPVLDGALSLTDVSAALLAGQWYWHLGASIVPISMLDFSHAVGWPAMQGKLAASIPMVTYSNGMMRMEGAMGLNVFDGSVVVDNLTLQDPLSAAPRLTADIRMRDLDLGLLTQTFSFGAISGKLDGDVQELELSRWQPVNFDASFRSSPGSYPKKISQRAVQNISALGGAGAAAAIQRSFLRFFEEFNYSRIGLSCLLRNGVCAMDGVEPAQNGYVIVKGSGIPAITVLGYNRSVSWDELLQRIRRVTSGNAKPVIK